MRVSLFFLIYLLCDFHVRSFKSINFVFPFHIDLDSKLEDFSLSCKHISTLQHFALPRQHRSTNSLWVHVITLLLSSHILLFHVIILPNCYLLSSPNCLGFVSSSLILLFHVLLRFSFKATKRRRYADSRRS